ncbi:MAG: hypothetical protein R2688_04960 [Fimbriimonadaceae bacterium]
MPTLQVEPRDKSKSAAVNRMRKDGVMPMAILTKKTGTQMVSADREEIKTVLDSIVGLPIFDVDGAAKTKVILKEVQRDAVSRKIIHMTVQEVADSDVIKVSIPVKVSGTPQAVAKRQSTLMVPMNALDVQAKVSDLPAEIAVNASNMTENDRIIVPIFPVTKPSHSSPLQKPFWPPPKSNSAVWAHPARRVLKGKRAKKVLKAKAARKPQQKLANNLSATTSINTKPLAG